MCHRVICKGNIHILVVLKIKFPPKTIVEKQVDPRPRMGEQCTFDIVLKINTPAFKIFKNIEPVKEENQK